MCTAEVQNMSPPSVIPASQVRKVVEQTLNIRHALELLNLYQNLVLYIASMHTEIFRFIKFFVDLISFSDLGKKSEQKFNTQE